MYLIPEAMYRTYFCNKRRRMSKKSRIPDPTTTTAMPTDQKVLINSMKAANVKTKWLKYK